VSRTRGDGRDLLLPLTLPELVLAIAGFLAPLALLVAYSFGEADFLTFDVAITGTIDSFRKLFSPTYRPVLVRSALLSAVTVAACTVIGTPAALAISRLPPRQARAILLAVIAPAFVSFAVRVHAWSNLLSSEGLVEQLSGRTLLFTPAGVALGMIGTYIPLFILPVVLALGRIELGVVEAAADLGAPPWRRTWTVVLPLARTGIVTGAVLVGVLAIGEYIVPTVLGGGRVLLLGNLLNDQAGGRDQPLGGAIAVVILTTMALGAALSRWGARRAS
jgi:ABC-type spermidine/putrescine transport system permease subunit I